MVSEASRVRIREGPDGADLDIEPMSRPKLAFVHDLPVGGAKRNFHSMLPLLAEKFDITVFEFDRPDQPVFAISGTPGQKHIFPAPSLGSTKMLKIPLLGQMLLDLYLVRFYRRITLELRKGAFDAVIVTQSRIINTPPLLRMLEPPIIYACHEPTRVLYEPYQYRSESPRRKLFRKLHSFVSHGFARRRERYLISKARVMLANSYYSAEVFYRLFGRPSVVAYPGVDGNVFRIQTAVRRDTVLSIGSLDIVKGHDFVIECLARVPREIRPSLCIVCPLGSLSESESAYLVALAERLGITIEIVSNISDEELALRYASAIATVFCPRLEPFGLVSVEAMACGCPVLALAEGGLRETVVDGETGFLLPRNPDAFAEKLVLLIQNDAERQRLGSNGARHTRAKFSWASHASAASEAIAQALKR